MEISLALEIARNIREIAVIKDERRSKRWIFPVFAAGRLKSESQVCHSSRKTVKWIQLSCDLARFQIDRTLFDPSNDLEPLLRVSFFRRWMHVCPSMRTCDRWKVGRSCTFRERCPPPLSSARVLFYAARQVLLATPRQRMLLRSYNDDVSFEQTILLIDFAIKKIDKILINFKRDKYLLERSNEL